MRYVDDSMSETGTTLIAAHREHNTLVKKTNYRSALCTQVNRG